MLGRFFDPPPTDWAVPYRKLVKEVGVNADLQSIVTPRPCSIPYQQAARLADGICKELRGRYSSLEITRQRLERTRSTSKVVSTVRNEIDLSLFSAALPFSWVLRSMKLNANSSAAPSHSRMEIRPEHRRS
jgi:hypothetical protein